MCVPVYIWCSAAMLFTCTLVLSCQLAGKGEHETWVVRTGSKILGGPKQTRRLLMKESNKSLSSILDRGHEGRICDVLQENSRSSMYKVYCVTERNCHELFRTLSEFHYDYLCSQVKFVILINVYFSQVKNKPWLPWVYSWIQHRREHAGLEKKTAGLEKKDSFTRGKIKLD
jgi:hypothetical protein